MRVNRKVYLSDCQGQKIAYSDKVKCTLNAVLAVEYTTLISFLLRKSWEECSWLRASNCYPHRFIMTFMHVSCVPRATHGQCLEHGRGSTAGHSRLTWNSSNGWSMLGDSPPVWPRLSQNCAADEGFSHPKSLPFLPPFLGVRPALQSEVSLHLLLLPPSFILPGHFPQ